MPLLDHFSPPLKPARRWESFFAAWAGCLADDLNSWLPKGYFAEEHTHLEPGIQTEAGPLKILPSGDFEVRVCRGSPPIRIATICLITPHNKDHIRSFAMKCAAYLERGQSLLLIDIVTNRHANLHAEIMELFKLREATHLPPEAALYAVAYRPLRRQGREEIDVCPDPLAVGATLPTSPLALTAELSMPIDLEATYMDARHRRRLA